MSATFATPLAAILLAVELLLFELRPRSLVPVAIASATAAVLRGYLLGPGPLFPMPAISGIDPLPTAVGSLLLGAVAWSCRRGHEPDDVWHSKTCSSGCLCTGCGGPPSEASGSVSVVSSFPRGLGVGYDNIAELLRGNAPLSTDSRHHPGQIAHVGVLARFRNFGRSSCAAAHDRRSGGCVGRALRSRFR